MQHRHRPRGQASGKPMTVLLYTVGCFVQQAESELRSLHRVRGGGGARVEYISFLTECLSSKIVFRQMHPHIKASKMIKLLKTGLLIL